MAATCENVVPGLGADCSVAAKVGHALDTAHISTLDHVKSLALRIPAPDVYGVLSTPRVPTFSCNASTADRLTYLSAKQNHWVHSRPAE
jgi:hypothetical protein